MIALGISETLVERSSLAMTLFYTDLVSVIALGISETLVERSSLAVTASVRSPVITSLCVCVRARACVRARE